LLKSDFTDERAFSDMPIAPSNEYYVIPGPRDLVDHLVLVVPRIVNGHLLDIVVETPLNANGQKTPTPVFGIDHELVLGSDLAIVETSSVGPTALGVNPPVRG
jgi:hypothetical protein